MAVPKALTAEQKRELVYAYLARPYGSKSQFLDEQGVSKAPTAGSPTSCTSPSTCSPG